MSDINVTGAAKLLRHAAEKQDSSMTVVDTGCLRTVLDDLDRERETLASAVRYLRAMAKGLRKEAHQPKGGGHYEQCSRDASVLEAAALDIEQCLHLDPDCLRDLVVTE